MYSHCTEICDAAVTYNYWNNLCHMLEMASLMLCYFMSKQSLFRLQSFFVSDIAICVLKRDGKLQQTN